jgi:ABC-type cobalamin/Fe3+-siderophores transport system ATPase subunit
VVFVSHMLHVVARYARRIAFLAGRGVVSGPADEMLTAPRLATLYGMDVVVGEVDGRRVVAPRARDVAP